MSNSKKWYPHNKGGSFRRWYGNSEYVIDYESNGLNLRSSENASVIPDRIVFRRCITYSRITSGAISFRVQPTGYLFDSAAVSIFPSKQIDYMLGLLNSSVIANATSFLVPTLNAQPGDIAKLPIALPENLKTIVASFVVQCESIAKLDWDSFETSWDFKRHPLL